MPSGQAEWPRFRGISQNAPAIARNSAGTVIAANGQDNSLWFYWNINGTSTRWPEEVSGPGTVSGGVAMTRSSGGTEIAVAGPDTG